MSTVYGQAIVSPSTPSSNNSPDTPSNSSIVIPDCNVNFDGDLYYSNILNVDKELSPGNKYGKGILIALSVLSFIFILTSIYMLIDDDKRLHLGSLLLYFCTFIIVCFNIKQGLAFNKAIKLINSIKISGKPCLDHVSNKIIS